MLNRLGIGCRLTFDFKGGNHLSGLFTTHQVMLPLITIRLLWLFAGVILWGIRADAYYINYFKYYY